MTIWEAASATDSLSFVLVGVVITLPEILCYNVMVYRIFRGKATHLSYD
jgi:cytochrome d ubiquinol oxidase subunit II